MLRNCRQRFTLKIQLCKSDIKCSILCGDHRYFVVNTVYAFNGQGTLSLIPKFAFEQNTCSVPNRGCLASLANELRSILCYIYSFNSSSYSIVTYSYFQRMSYTSCQVNDMMCMYTLLLYIKPSAFLCAF
jgi:hypothetical protein